MSDWVTVSIQDIVSKMNKAGRGLFPICNALIDDRGTEPDLQVTKCDVTSESGFHLQIPGRITTSLMNLGIGEPEHGGFKVTLMQNGNLPVQVLSYGLMENVSNSYPCSLLELMIAASEAGAGKSIISCDNLSI